MVKFCKNIVLAISRISNEVIPFPPHKLKRAEEYVKNNWSGHGDVITVENKNFSIGFGYFQYKYYGCNAGLIISHPNLNRGVYGNPSNENEFFIIITTMAFTEILEKYSISEGKLQGTFSIEAMNYGRVGIIKDTAPEIPIRTKEYDRYYDNPKTSALKLGGVYLNQDGYYYLSISDPIYSRACGYGYSHEGYGLSHYWSISSYPSPKKVDLMIFLGNDWNFVKSVMSDDKFNLGNFICDQINSRIIEIESCGGSSLDSNNLLRNDTIIRLKKHTSGSFVKVGEIDSVKVLYKSLGGCYGLRHYLINTIIKEILDNGSKPYANALNPANYSALFHLIPDKDRNNTLSSDEKAIYRETVIFQIQVLRKFGGYNYILGKYFSEFIKPDPKNINNAISEEGINALFDCISNVMVGTETKKYKELINLGVFGDREEIVKEIKIAMYGRSE